MDLVWTLLVMTPTVPVIGWLGSLAYDKWLGVEDSNRWFEKYEEKILFWTVVFFTVLGIPLLISFLIFLVGILRLIVIS